MNEERAAIDMLSLEARDRGKAEGRDKERSAIVALLRQEAEDNADPNVGRVLRAMIEAIERSEHNHSGPDAGCRPLRPLPPEPPAMSGLFRRLWRRIGFGGAEPRPALICMRLDQMVVVHPQQIVLRCEKCGSEVGIYPSGQAVLEAYPDTRIVCHVCQPPGIGTPAPGAEAELFQSVRR